MQKITPCLWFDDNAEEAVKFYTSLFKNSKILQVSHYGEAGSSVAGRPKGSVMTITFQLEGQEFMALNGGPHFKPTPAISLMVNCENPGGDRSILGQALGRGWDATVRLAHGQIRRFLADRPRDSRADDAGRSARESRKSHEGNP